MPKVSVIILNWNQPEFTVKCIRSVLEQSYQDFEILLVDNNSDDNSVYIFKRKFGKNTKIRIIENQANLGYAGGNNTGVRTAKGKYICILNNDTEVKKNWLKELVEGLESSEKIGAVSSTGMLDKERRERLFRTTRFTTSLLGYPSQLPYEKKLEKLPRLVDNFTVRGASFIYRKDLVKLPFDSEYFIYYEDTYLGWLLRLKGYENKIAPGSVLFHKKNVVRKTKKKINRHFIFLGERNRLMNFLLFYEAKNMVRVLPLMLSGIFLSNLLELRKMSSRMSAYLWLLINLERIWKKRVLIQKEREVPDEEIIKEMSCQFYAEEKFGRSKFLGKILRVMNSLAFIYCKMVNLKTIEG